MGGGRNDFAVAGWRSRGELLKFQVFEPHGY